MQVRWQMLNYRGVKRKDSSLCKLTCPDLSEKSSEQITRTYCQRDLQGIFLKQKKTRLATAAKDKVDTLSTDTH